MICPPSIINQEIDFSRWFMPQELTPLFHTAVYRDLREAEQLRYNQLNALYFNEQIMFFERKLAQNVIAPFIGAGLPPKVELGLKQFLREEQEHSTLFLELNRKCAPELYRDRDFHFVRISAVGASILSWMSKRPHTFPLFLWLAHLQEERSIYFGRKFLRSQDCVESSFRDVHRKHLADEARHVQWDAWLLDYVWPQTAGWLRTANAKLLGTTVREFFAAPKRATLNVVRQLVIEMPHLRDREEDLLHALRSLSRDPVYCKSIYSHQSVPDTFARFDAWPELRALSRYFPGYSPLT